VRASVAAPVAAIGASPYRTRLYNQNFQALLNGFARKKSWRIQFCLDSALDRLRARKYEILVFDVVVRLDRPARHPIGDHPRNI
jgi:hypothetical protein